MTGVEILARQEVATAFAFSWENFWIIMGMAIGVGLIFGILVSAAEDCWWNLAVVIPVAVIGVILGLIVGFGAGVPTEYETEYKVIISDEVPMNEFTERYEIVDKEGKIYTVRERD